MKTKFKKTVAIALATTLSLGTTIHAKIIGSDSSIVSPYYVAINNADCAFSEVYNGLHCYGETYVKNGYTAYVKVELQQYGSQWTTINTWSSQSPLQATIDKTITPVNGYLYRLKVTHIAYNSSGAQVEKDTSYSNEIFY